MLSHTNLSTPSFASQSIIIEHNSLSVQKLCYSKVQKFSLLSSTTDTGDSKTHIYLVTLCRKEKRL